MTDQYQFQRVFYDYRFLNPNKLRAIHADLLWYILNLHNKVGHKARFGLPTMITMEALGIGSRNTYYKALNELIEIGFVIQVSEAKNQNQARVISLPAVSIIKQALEQADEQALDHAHIQALELTPEHIDKQSNNQTNKQVDDVETSTKPKSSISIDKCKKYFLQDESAINAIITNKDYKLSGTDMLFDRLNDFDGSLRETGQLYKTLIDYYKHFTSWLKKQPSVTSDDSYESGKQKLV